MRVNISYDEKGFHVNIKTNNSYESKIAHILANSDFAENIVAAVSQEYKKGSFFYEKLNEMCGDTTIGDLYGLVAIFIRKICTEGNKSLSSVCKRIDAVMVEEKKKETANMLLNFLVAHILLSFSHLTEYGFFTAYEEIERWCILNEYQ